MSSIPSLWHSLKILGSQGIGFSPFVLFWWDIFAPLCVYGISIFELMEEKGTLTKLIVGLFSFFIVMHCGGSKTWYDKGDYRFLILIPISLKHRIAIHLCEYILYLCCMFVIPAGMVLLLSGVYTQLITLLFVFVFTIIINGFITAISEYHRSYMQIEYDSITSMIFQSFILFAVIGFAIFLFRGGINLFEPIAPYGLMIGIILIPLTWSLVFYAAKMREDRDIKQQRNGVKTESISGIHYIDQTMISRNRWTTWRIILSLIRVDFPMVVLVAVFALVLFLVICLIRGKGFDLGFYEGLLFLVYLFSIMGWIPVSPLKQHIRFLQTLPMKSNQAWCGILLYMLFPVWFLLEILEGSYIPDSGILRISVTLDIAAFFSVIVVTGASPMEWELGEDKGDSNAFQFTGESLIVFITGIVLFVLVGSFFSINSIPFQCVMLSILIWSFDRAWKRY